MTPEWQANYLQRTILSTEAVQSSSEHLAAL